MSTVILLSHLIQYLFSEVEQSLILIYLPLVYSEYGDGLHNFKT